MDEHYRRNHYMGDLQSLLQTSLKKRIDIAEKTTKLRRSYLNSVDEKDGVKAYLLFLKEQNDEAKANEIQELEKLYAELDAKTDQLKLDFDKSVKELQESARLINLMSDRQAETENN